jgi:hypothetical protein
MNKSKYGRNSLTRFAFLLLLVLLLVSGREAAKGLPEIDGARKDQTLKPQVPQSLRSEHEELHAQLANAAKAGGATGSAAAVVAKLLDPHFLKEEEYALPPLGLLRELAAGKVTAEMRGVVAMTDKLKEELPRMLEEHKAIVAALEQLTEAAKREGKNEHIHFAEKLMLHAQNEEQVLYPASILVGEYLKMRLGR